MHPHTASAPPRRFALALTLALAGFAAGCGPQTQIIGEAFTSPELRADAVQTADGSLLPMRSWLPAGKPKAVILALHGMNEHAGYFDMPAEAWRRAGIAVYAYDQRGYGAAAQTGVWPGADVLAGDFAVAVELLRRRHPGLPVYAVGSSMGGGVILVAMAKPDAPAVNGIILEAPAVWSRSTMPAYQSALLWMAAYTVPTLAMTGRGLNIVPSDNREMLRQRWRDPLVQKSARVDALWGVVELMDRAYAAAPRIRVPTLLLYGEKDQVVPRRPIEDVARRLPADVRHVAIYENGWHMLFRDLGRATVHGDVAAWIGNRGAPLPSGADRGRAAAQVTGLGSNGTQ
jgi:alpha-beta hydrolase superfamily lysophospholipase